MRRRSERQQDFESIKQNLFAAGVSTVKAAKAQEEMFTTTLEALTDAYEEMGGHQLEASKEDMNTSDVDVSAIATPLISQRQSAIANQDYDAFVAAEEKLQRLDELAVLRLERQVRLLKAQQQLTALTDTGSPAAAAASWTESALKKEYGTVTAVRQAFGIKARTWKDAVEQVNQPVSPSED